MQRIDALKAIADNLRDLILDSTVASAYATAVRADDLIQPQSKQLQGFNFYSYGGLQKGQERVVGSLDTTNRVILFTQDLSPVPSTSAQFILTEFWAKSQYDNALDRYIGKAKTKFLEQKAATLSLVATQYEYPVPSGFEWISTLRLVPSTNSDYANTARVSSVFELGPRFWRIEPNTGGSYLIIIDSRQVNLDNFNNYLVRVEGQAKPDIAGTDNATIPEDIEEYVITGASMLLSSQRISENEEWRRKFYMFRDEFRPLEDYVYRYGRGKKVK